MTPAEERRTVVILFAQAAGLAELPEAERAPVTDALFRRLRAVVERGGGVVDKFIGDVVMALWGAPVAHEDDPARAVRAAISMAREVETFAGETGRELLLRAGLNRGEVLFGSVGGDRPTAMGDPVNVAQRLMAAAEVGTVLVEAGVVRLARASASFGATRPIPLKGRDRVVEAAVAEAVVAGRTEIRLAPEHSAPLVGREDDLARLHALLADTHGAFAVVTGDAGIGKSRLLAEFRTQLRARQASTVVLVGRALQDVRLPLLPFGEMLRHDSGIAGFGAADAARLVAWLEDGLVETLPDKVRRENAAHLVALSAGYDVPGARVKDMEPARVEAETRRAWAAWFRARSAHGPVLAVVEDLHWADAATLELLESLAAALRGAPVAILATSRPEGRRPAGFESVALGEIGAEAALRLAESAFRAPVTPELAAFLAEKSGGNPYYLEELVHFLRDEKFASGRPVKLDVPPSRLPDGLQGLLVARLDGLETEARGVLKAAGAIGRVFWHDLLGRLAATEAAPALEAARHREIAFPQDDSLLPGDAQWIFKHALLRDAAYSLLTRKERKRLHAAAADRLGEIAASAGRAVRALAAAHREAAGEEAAAAALWLACATEAKQNSAWAESLSDAREAVRLGGGAEARLAAADALQLLGRFRESLAEVAAAGDASPATTASLRIVQSKALLTLGEFRESLAAAEAAVGGEAGPLVLSEAHLVQGSALRKLGRIDEAQAAFGRCLEIAATASPRRAAGRLVVNAELGLADLDGLAGRSAEALARVLQALDGARALGDESLTGRALSAVGSVREERSEFAEARIAHEACLEIQRRLGDRVSVASQTNNLANLDARAGRMEAARDGQLEAIAVARELGDGSRLATYLSNLANSLSRLGRYRESIPYLDESLALARAAGDPSGISGTLVNLGISQAILGDSAASLASFRESLALRESLGDVAGCARCHNNIGQLFVRIGDLPQGIASLEEAIRLRRQCGDRAGEASSLGNLGGALREAKLPERAMTCLQESIAVSRSLGERIALPHSLNTLGATLVELGRRDEAGAAFREARELFRIMADPIGLATTLRGLAELLEPGTEAEALDREALQLSRGTGDQDSIADCLAGLGSLLARLGRHGEAVSLFEEAAGIRRSLGQKEGEAACHREIDAAKTASAKLPP
ncbi:MAG: tetratricopeptide repeat protein [Planctomycetes bacterium]|nr:tetratricopeptide repeat protein [Planctomycetota bacterium]